MNKVKLALITLIRVSLLGCAGKKGMYVPSYALTDPAQGASIPHPVTLERSQVKAITIFTAPMDASLLVEVVAGGGVWPALGQKENGELIRGYAYLAGLNYWGDFVLQFIFPASKTELAGVRFLYFNRDGGWAYQINGQEVNALAQTKKAGEKEMVIYDPAKFDKSEADRKKVLTKYGWTLTEIESVIGEYLKDKDVSITPDRLIVEVEIGSPAWEEYKKHLAVKFPENYKLPGNEIRCGYLPLEMFRDVATEVPGFTGGQKYLKHANIPLAIVPFTGAGMAVSAAAGLVGTAVVAGVDDNWDGYYARATVLRHQLAPTIKWVCESYKELLRKRDQIIRNQETQLWLRRED
jgi:hypothetical protein